MKIFVLGTRGIPRIQGGVETHCEELYPRLVKLGCDVTLITRTPYVEPDNRLDNFRGVKLKHLYAPKNKSLEAIIHSLLGVLYARLKSPDLLHIHAIGPSLVVPVARLLGLRTVVTHHGPDYDRQKWGKAAKSLLRLGEFFAAKFSNEIIVISEVIGNILKIKYGRSDYHLIHNGVNNATTTAASDYIDALGLSKGKYIIGVGRFVKEKGFHDLIEAFFKLNPDDIKLVLVGDADHETEYSQQLKQLAKEEGAVLTGFIKGEQLQQIFSHAGLFVMPSYHEGLPIALLEAMSYGLPVLVSDIPANLEVPLDKSCYFNIGDNTSLAAGITRQLASASNTDYSSLLASEYDWDHSAKQTLDVYEKMVI